MAARRGKRETMRRHIFVGVVFLLWSAGIGWRLFHLQVTRHQEFAERSEAQRRRELKLSPPRGDILDRRGKALANSVVSTTIYADPKMIRSQRKSDADLKAEREKAAAEGAKEKEGSRKASTRTPKEQRSYEQEIELSSRVIAGIVGEKDPTEFRNQLMRDDTNYVRLVRRLDPKQSEQIRAAIAENDLIGLGLEQEPIRVFPHKQLASHVLGFVNNDEEGVSGVELQYNKELRGSGGTVRLENDALGRAFDRQDEEPKKGATITTTIDLQLQAYVDEALKVAVQETKSRAASAVVLEVGTGEILALANYPTFDPNLRLKDSDSKKQEREMDARRNRAITDYYEPGSVFKMVTFSAALEQGLITPDTKVSADGGSITLFGRTIGDHVSGVLTASQALAKSSNVVSIKLALDIRRHFGEDKFVEYMNRFGFGKLTGIDLPGEIRGVVHPPSRWGSTSIASMAIGQEVGVTVLQVVSAMAAIANGGTWVQPHIVKQIMGADGHEIYKAKPEERLSISNKTAHDIKGMLEETVVAGTARHAVKLPGYTAAGKTGTPQKVDPETHRYSHTKFMPTFAGFVPASAPRFAIIVMLDEPIGLHQGGQVSAPVFKTIAEAALLDYGISPDSPEFKASMGVLAARLRGKGDESSSDSIDGDEVARNGQLDSSGPPAASPDAQGYLKVALPGSTAATPKEPIASPAAQQEGVMPDLRGKSLRELARMCRKADLRIRVKGEGLAVSQTPAAGAPIQAGDQVTVELK